MKKLLLLLLILLDVYAKNPLIYAQVGDEIYNFENDLKFLNIKINFLEFNLFLEKLEKTKQLGYQLDKNITKDQSEIYLDSLRELKSEYKRLKYVINIDLNNNIYKDIKTLNDSNLTWIKDNQIVKLSLYSFDINDSIKVSTNESIHSTLPYFRNMLLNSRENNTSISYCLNELTALNVWLKKIQQDIYICNKVEYFKQINQYRLRTIKECQPISKNLSDVWAIRSKKVYAMYQKKFEKSCVYNKPKDVNITKADISELEIFEDLDDESLSFDEDGH